jgi:hypothetical protein
LRLSRHAADKAGALGRREPDHEAPGDDIRLDLPIRSPQSAQMKAVDEIRILTGSERADESSSASDVGSGTPI